MPSQTTYPITNAGLILLWPFLTALFDRAGLVHEAQFIDQPAQLKAARLLHYLVFDKVSETRIEEPLTNILCGLPPAEAVAAKALDKADLELCDSLLNVIPARWDKLSNTTTETLQTSFLQRPGMLSQNEGWRLKVEKRGYDVLLQSLPWSYSMVRLGWMEEVVWVEWG